MVVSENGHIVFEKKTDAWHPKGFFPPSGGGSWHAVPDGRGNCKAMGTPVFCPHPKTKTGEPKPSGQLVKKHACGGFFDDFCTVCLGAYGSPGGKRR